MNEQLTFADTGHLLHETTFIVVDLETTGGSALNDSITEIGAVKIRAGEILGEFSTLVNPGSAIPPFITVLTGITDAMVIEAPRIEEVFPAFLEFCNPDSKPTLVAHNAPFDVGFLKQVAQKLDYPWPNFSVLDTARLARTIISKDEVSNHKLGTLAAYFGATTTPNHRALDDARATVDVLHGLFERLGNLGIHTVQDLKTFSHQISPLQKNKKHLAQDLPSNCGIYIFRDAKDAPLYVGVSQNIRSRVKSYFTSSEQRKRIIDMIGLAERIDYKISPTYLAAAVEELRVIEASQPRFNRRSTRQSDPLYVSLTNEMFPRLSITKNNSTPHIGPFTSRAEATLAIEAIYEAIPLRQCTPRITIKSMEKATSCVLAGVGKCGAPCIGEQSRSDYSALVELTETLFSSNVDFLVNRVDERMRALALDERFEDAAQLRNRTHAFLKGAARAIRLGNFSNVELIITATSNFEGEWEVNAIHYGRLVASEKVSSGYSPMNIIESLSTSEFEVERASFEESELLMRHIFDPKTRIARIRGEWAHPIQSPEAFLARFTQPERERPMRSAAGIVRPPRTTRISLKSDN